MKRLTGRGTRPTHPDRRFRVSAAVLVEVDVDRPSARLAEAALRAELARDPEVAILVVHAVDTTAPKDLE